MSTTDTGLVVAGVAMELGLDAVVIGSGVLDGSGRAQVAFAPFVRALADTSKIFVQGAVSGANFIPFLPTPAKAIRNVAVAGAVLNRTKPHQINRCPSASWGSSADWRQARTR